MDCVIYRSNRKQDTYLYVVEEGNFSQVPEELLKLVGATERVMALTLSPERKLAREDVDEVIKSLRERGWFLQMPRRDEGMH